MSLEQAAVRADNTLVVDGGSAPKLERHSGGGSTG